MPAFNQGSPIFPSARLPRSTRTTPEGRSKSIAASAQRSLIFLWIAAFTASAAACAQTNTPQSNPDGDHAVQAQSPVPFQIPVVQSNPSGTVEDGGFQTYRPTPDMDMRPQTDNPFLGSWTASRSFPPVPGTNVSSTMLIFAQYLPNGNFRSTALVRGGFMNGARLQLWGQYTVRQTGEKTYILTATPEGILPHEFCIADGQCQQNPIPAPNDETDELQTPDLFRSKSTLNGVVTDLQVHRSPFPAVLATGLDEKVKLPIPQADIPVLYVPDPHPNLGDRQCDNLQQRRICAVNEGAIYTDQRGCKMCASPEDVKSGKIKPDEPVDTQPIMPTITPY